MIGYLIVIQDTHTDPEYLFKWDKEEALNEANNCIAVCCEQYSLAGGEVERYPCDGKYGFWLSAQCPSGSFHVSVREIEIPEK